MKEIPPGSMLPQPHSVEDGDAAREDFYKLALSRVRVISEDESTSWFSNAFGKHCRGLAAVLVARDTEKRVRALDFVLVKSLFTLNGENYEDLMPFVAEHELYEAWLLAKSGKGPAMSGPDRHLAARRREFLFAEAAGKSDRLKEWYGQALSRMGATQDTLAHYDEECLEAIEYARLHPEEVAAIGAQASW